MKQFAWILVLILLSAGVCVADGPHIKHIADETAESSVLRQSIDLWVDAAGPWSFRAESLDSFKLRDHNTGKIDKTQIISGNGPEQSSHVLEVHFDLESLGVGMHRLQMEVVLEGAQGILGLPLTSAKWILPLNTELVGVDRGGDGLISIPQGQWFLLEPGDELYYAGREVGNASSEVQPAAIQSESIQTKLWWGTVPLHLKTGDWGNVRLHLTGPYPGGELTLYSNQYLYLGRNWSIAGQELEYTVESQGRLILQIPTLPPGIHVLSGSVQALLPPPAGQGEILAVWKDNEALSRISIDRSWFDHDGVQTIQIDSPSSLILPSGRRASSSKTGQVIVPGEGLGVIIPVDNPAHPIWTGLPLAESIVWSPGTHEFGGPLDFFLPVFLWDEGFSWRLITRSGPWSLDATAERQRFAIGSQVGSTSVEVSSAQERITISGSVGETCADAGWRWRETADLRSGTYTKGRWQWAIDIPRESGHEPSMAIGYGGENFGFRVTPQDVKLRFSSETWTWGARLGSPMFWAETVKPHLRLEVRPERVLLDYEQSNGGKVKLSWNVRQSLGVCVTADPWEGYLSIGPKGYSEGGLRLKQTSSQGRLLSVAKAALQVNNRVLLIEAGGQLGYVLAPWVTLYGEGACGASISRQGHFASMDFRFGGGVILSPLPQLVATAGWNNQEQWHLKAGVVLPFVGRNVKNNLE